jgi:pantetheine-phosphate adenylyltransferase
MKEKRIAIVPGSFDPITNGHVDLVRRAAQTYDFVYLAVMINAEKRYMFTMEQRKRIAEAAVRELPNVTVITSEGMLWQLAKELKACAIIKGYRNEVDLAYEQRMAEYNSERYPEAKTVLLPSDATLVELSSTAVRAKILERGDLSPYLPAGAIDEIYKIIPRTL